MAAVTRVKAIPCSPPGYEVNDRGQTSVALTAGDLLVLTATTPASGFEKVWTIAPTSCIRPDGIALMDAKANGIVSVGVQGEMDGFSGLTPANGSNLLYPSASVAGGIDTTAPTAYSAATTPAVAVPAHAFVKAVSTTRIRFNFL